jgi:DNA-directed RNA polymerase specialized sigma24 family protein
VSAWGKQLSSDDARLRANARFPDTSWGLVLAAGDRGDAHASEAFASLCRQYWMPIYAGLRRQGFASSDAEDLTQGFFLHLIDGGGVSRADPDRGRFRSFLLGALRRFLANDRDREHARKRGGDRTFVAIDAATVEAQLPHDDDGAISLQLQFDRRWARTLVSNALATLGAEHAASGEAELFAALQPCLGTGGEAPPYGELAVRLARNEGAVKTAVHRLRRRFREVLRREVAHTVAAPEEIDDELTYLRDVLAAEPQVTVP